MEQNRSFKTIHLNVFELTSNLTGSKHRLKEWVIGFDAPGHIMCLLLSTMPRDAFSAVVEGYEERHEEWLAVSLLVEKVLKSKRQPVLDFLTDTQNEQIRGDCVDALFLLASSKESRVELRERCVYEFVREYHPMELHDATNDQLFALVDLLLAEEEDELDDDEQGSDDEEEDLLD